MNIKSKTSVATAVLAALYMPALMAETPNTKSVETMETIIVTAELLEKEISQTNNSVEVFSQYDLENRAGLNTLRDVLDSVGNVSQVTGTGKAPTVRGVDGTGAAENANAFFAGSRPRLSWQIDGRPASYNEVVFADSSIFDIAQIEVLRGPQSSLVGRNAIAGTVIVNTQDPVFEHQGKVKLVAGDHQLRQASAMLNLPISDDSVALRIAADWLEKQSQTDYDAYQGVADPGQIQSKNLRAKLLFKPEGKDDEKLLINLAHNSYLGPNGEIIVQPFEQRRSNFPLQPQHKPENTSVAVDYELALTEQWQLAFNTSVTDFTFIRNAAPNTSNARIDTKEYVVEPQLSFKDDAAAGVIGLYYYKADQKEFIEFLSAQNFTDKADTIAAYAEGAMPLTDTIELSLGLRYEHEQRTRQGGDATGAIANIFSDESYDLWLPKVGINWQSSKTTNFGLQVSKGYNAGGGGITFAFPIVNYSYDKETVWTLDTYARQQFAQGKIKTTQNLFYSKYQDMQLPFDLTPENSHDEAFVVRNANQVDTFGAELGISAYLANNWELWGNLSLLNTEISDYPNSGVEGNELLTAPSVTAKLGFSWQHNNWQTSLNTRYSDGYFTDVNNRPRGKTDGYLVVHGQVSYQGENYRVFATVKNLFDSDRPISRYPGTAPADSQLPDSAFDSTVILQPRSVQLGIEFSY